MYISINMGMFKTVHDSSILAKYTTAFEKIEGIIMQREFRCCLICLIL